MAVDLGGLVDLLKAEVNSPGNEAFPDANDEIWLNNLINGFWEARLDGLLGAWTADEDGVVTPINSGGEDMPRDYQQLVILYASFSVIRSELRRLRTQFSASAGSVKYEYQQSSYLFVELMKDVVSRKNIILTRLSDLGAVPTYITNAVIARTNSISYGDDWFLG